MTSALTYVLDANVFMQAAREYYAFEIAPIFWESLKNKASSGRVLSIDRVARELSAGKDELAQWAENEFSRAFARTDTTDVVRAYTNIVEWVHAQKQFKEAEKAKFCGGSDGWLIAYAKVRDYVVVTQEQEVPKDSHKVKIPNVCRAFNVPFVDTFGMLRDLGIRFT